MDVRVSKRTADSIERLVNCGAYQNAQSVVEEAVRQLAEADQEYVAELHRLIEEGVRSLRESGGTPWTPDLADRIIDEARRQRVAGGGRG